MTREQARKILCEYLDLDKEEHSEFLDAIRTLIQPQAEKTLRQIHVGLRKGEQIKWF